MKTLSTFLLLSFVLSACPLCNFLERRRGTEINVTSPAPSPSLSNTNTMATTNYNPFTGSLQSIMPQQVGPFRMWQALQPQTPYGGMTEYVVGYYETPDGQRAVFNVRNYPSAQAANDSLQSAIRSVAEVYRRPPRSATPGVVVKRGQTVGAMILIVMDDGREIVIWTDGSLRCEVLAGTGYGRVFFDNMTF